MDATMMEFPLTLDHFLERARLHFGEVEIVSQMADKSLRRHTYRDLWRRSRALAQGLMREGLGTGDRVATLMWNHHAHIETYFGAPIAGGVYHTLNLRLAPADLIYIINHAADRFLIIDDVLLKLYQAIADKIEIEKVFVVRHTDAPLPEGLHDYESLIEGADDAWSGPVLDESQGAGLCYTSGTTGRPKGVLYSHRAIALHSLASGLVDTLNVSARDTVLPVVPQFHANAWGLPFTCTMIGCKQVMPGPHLDGKSLLDLYQAERVTLSAGVPTIWLGILQELDKNPGGWDLVPGMRMVVGGSAAPRPMIKKFDSYDMRVVHAWGMTEMSPLGTVAALYPHHDDLDDEAQLDARARQGSPAPFVEIRVVNEDGIVPWDNEAFGELQVRGPWVAASYFNSEEDADKWTDDGWFATGDVVTVDPHGSILITDRAKDVIKSGGEWISSQALENALMGHEAIAQAAVIAVADATYGERPLAVLVPCEGASVDDEALAQFLLDQGFAKWWLPDGYERIEAIPLTATGKFLKTALREQFAGWTKG